MNQSIVDQSIVGEYYFKVARTTNTKTYLLPSNISVQEFFRVVTIHIMDDFGYTTLNDFEFVLAGQQLHGIRYAEDVPAIDISNLTGTLYDNYSESNSFYIRPIIDPTIDPTTNTTIDHTTDSITDSTTDQINE
jgi:hypothetical protein